MQATAVGSFVVLSILCSCALGDSDERLSLGSQCMPEQIPEGGFSSTEAYLETSSVQCVTDVCMVFQLEGDPSQDCAVASTPLCTEQEEVARRVYCTCRCDAPSSPGAAVCTCPDDFVCHPVLELGGPGVEGSYCVRKGTL